MIQATGTSKLDRENPWPGLESYEESANDYFCGREHEAERLLDKVLDAPVTVLYGRSGLGKTSLLRAGLFPLLRERDFLPIYVRFELAAGCGAVHSPASRCCPRIRPRGSARCDTAVGSGISLGVPASR